MRAKVGRTATDAWEKLGQRDAQLQEAIETHFEDPNAGRRHGAGRRRYRATASGLSEAHELLNHWVEVGLVGFVRPDAMFFVWDQCFLSGWPEHLGEFACDLLQLLRKDLLGARDADEVERLAHSLLQAPNATPRRCRPLRHRVPKPQAPQDRSRALPPAPYARSEWPWTSCRSISNWDNTVFPGWADRSEGPHIYIYIYI